MSQRGTLKAHLVFFKALGPPTEILILNSSLPYEYKLIIKYDYVIKTVNILLKTVATVPDGREINRMF